ncbi:MAG: collagen-like protein [Christensenellaceae bacterium]|jgi:hypothetical protein|nr:collagen-like protein [Christensenellaceae bacterium]
MKKHLSVFSAAIVLVLSLVFLVACSGENGKDGLPGAPGATGSTGPQGIPGLIGSNGPQGIPGENGINGTNGTNGTNGLPGATGATGSGEKGDSGLSAYEIYLKYHPEYTKTEFEWLNQLIANDAELLTPATPPHTEGLEFEFFNDDGSYPNGYYNVTGYSGNAADIIIPNIYAGLPVVGIDAPEGSGIFAGDDNITSVVIMDGVKIISESSFEDCANLESVTIPSSIKLIDNSSFAHTPKLTEFNLPSSASGLAILDEVFNDSGVTRLIIPEGTVRIGSRTFINTSALETLIIPDSIEYLGISLIDDCALTDVFYTGSETDFADILSDTDDTTPIITMGDNDDLFAKVRYYSALPVLGTWDYNADDEPTIQTTYTLYGYSYNEFILKEYGATAPKDVIIPAPIDGNSIMGIDNNAFDGLGITSIVIPDSVIALNTQAFINCDTLETVYFGGTEIYWAAIGNINAAGNEQLYNAPNIYFSDQWEFDAETGLPTILID